MNSYQANLSKMGSTVLLRSAQGLIITSSRRKFVDKLLLSETKHMCENRSFLSKLTRNSRYLANMSTLAPTTAPECLLKPMNFPIKTLMGPGPSNCPPRVLNASALPLLGHLHPEFTQVRRFSLSVNNF